MALTVSGRQTVRTLKEAFKNEFGVNIRVYHGVKFADDDATLASIRTEDAPRKGDFEVHGRTKVGNVEKQFLEGLGIRVKLENSEGELADKEISLTATASNYRPAKKEEEKGAGKTAQVESASEGGPRQRFWREVSAGLTNKLGLKTQAPKGSSSLEVSLGRTGFFLSSILTQSGETAVRFLLNGKGKDEIFQELLAERNKIEQALGAALTWSDPGDARKIISVTGPTLNLDKEADFASAVAWMVDWIAKFKAVFEPRMKNNQPLAAQDGKKSNTLLIVALLAVLAALAGGAYLFMRPAPSSAPVVEQTPPPTSESEITPLITAADMSQAIEDIGYVTLYIHFDLGKTEIKPVSMPAIFEIVTMMREKPNMRLSVEGHTDSVGTSESNRLLSEGRAQAVREAIIAGSIAGDRLTFVGHGQEKPIADNTTEEGRAKNRRVELVRQ